MNDLLALLLPVAEKAEEEAAQVLEEELKSEAVTPVPAMAGAETGHREEAGEGAGSLPHSEASLEAASPSWPTAAEVLLPQLGQLGAEGEGASLLLRILAQQEGATEAHRAPAREAQDAQVTQLAQLAGGWGTAPWVGAAAVPGYGENEWGDGESAAPYGKLPFSGGSPGDAAPMEQVVLQQTGTGAGISLAQLDKAMERDARRYDHGFTLR
jgi:hypothetical protein